MEGQVCKSAGQASQMRGSGRSRPPPLASCAVVPGKRVRHEHHFAGNGFLWLMAMQTHSRQQVKALRLDLQRRCV